MHINPKMITWARKRNGLSIKNLAVLMNRNTQEIEEWEKGKKSPSYTTLEELSYRHLKIPLALFFFSEPPIIEDPVKKFRRLPDYELSRISYSTYHLIRIAQSYQDSLTELLSEIEPSANMFDSISAKGINPLILARKVREHLGIPIEKQLGFRSNEEAFKAWRYVIEQAGVFTFKDSFKDRFISGFCLLDDDYPIIMINNSSAFARQTFTLLHELGHILYRVNGITDVDESYIQYMHTHDKQIEINCNKFSSEVLVPRDAFREDIRLFKSKGHDVIPIIASKYSVSREVILRKLFDHDLISTDIYEKRAEQWNRDYLRAKKEREGGNYYLTRMAYLGAGFTKIAYENYYRGRLSKAQLATHLNINSRNIDKLERYVTY